MYVPKLFKNDGLPLALMYSKFEKQIYEKAVDWLFQKWKFVTAKNCVFAIEHCKIQSKV